MSAYYFFIKETARLTSVANQEKPAVANLARTEGENTANADFEISKTPTIAGLANNVKFEGIEAVAVANGYAYAVGDGVFSVINVSDPKNPVASIATTSTNGEKLPRYNGIYISGKYVYAISGNGSLYVFDISTPSAPMAVGALNDAILFNNDEMQGIYVSGNYVYAVAGRSEALTVIDVSDPKKPTIASSLPLADPRDTSWAAKANWPSAVFVSNGYAYITNEQVNGGIWKILAIDISNPKSPSITGRYYCNAARGQIYVSGKYAYIAGDGNFEIIDVSNPASMQDAGSIHDKRLERANGVIVSGKYAYVGTDAGLAILSISNPSAPEIVASISDPKLEGGQNPYVSGQYVYLPSPDANNLAIIDLKGESIFIPIYISVLSENQLNLAAKPITNNEGEIAFVKDGDIWLVGKDLKSEQKIVDTAENITKFSFSFGGKEIYWLNEKGEIWKKAEDSAIKALVTVAGDMKKKMRPADQPVPYYEGSVNNFWLSPDGKYIAYQTLEDFFGCCGAQYPFEPDYGIRIMDSNGLNKIKLNPPKMDEFFQIGFDGWMPDSKKIFFHLFNGEEPGAGSLFYEFGPDGKNPKVSDINSAAAVSNRIDVIKDTPVISPNGQEVAFTSKDGVSLVNVGNKKTKNILVSDNIPYDSPNKNLVWSDDGSYLAVKENGEVIIFDDKGNIIRQTKLNTNSIDGLAFSPDNKYLGGVYLLNKERVEVIFYENITTGEKHEFKLPDPKTETEATNIHLQFFSNSDRLYYLTESGKENSTYELCFIDTNNMKNYSIADKVLQAVRLP